MGLTWTFVFSQGHNYALGISVRVAAFAVDRSFFTFASNTLGLIEPWAASAQA
jgi:hypothetical protein